MFGTAQGTAFNMSTSKDYLEKHGVEVRLELFFPFFLQVGQMPSRITSAKHHCTISRR